MKRLALILPAALFGLFVHGCGGEKAVESEKSASTEHSAPVPDKDEELEKHLLMLINTMPPSAAFALGNIRLAVRMYPEQCLRTLMKVIEEILAAGK